MLFTISSYNSQHNFIKFSFPESASHVECIDWKKFRKNPDSGKKPDSKFFRIFSKMIFSRNFVIIKCFSFFNIIIFKAAMVFLKISMKKATSLARSVLRYCFAVDGGGSSPVLCCATTHSAAEVQKYGIIGQLLWCRIISRPFIISMKMAYFSGYSKRRI